MDFSKLKDMGRKYVDKARQIAEGLTELEIKVEEATNDDKWGPHGQLMAEITKESFREEEYKEILAVLARRLASEPNKWRRVYKSLLLLEYMAKNGPERMVAELKSNQNVFNRLQTFEFIDDAGKDQGLNVRNRAKELWNLVNDPDHIAHERERAGANRNKYAGFDARALNSNINAGGRVSGGSSRSGGFAGASEAPPRSSDGEDPVEATRKRLAALKAAEEEAASVAANAPADAPVVQKKKLSDVKVDSSIAATLAKNFKTLAPTTSAPSAPVSSGPDLLAFDEVPSSAPAAASGGDDWASFESAPPAKAAPAPAAPAPAAKAADPFAAVAAGDDWSNFASAPAPAPISTAADPLAGLSVVAPPPSSSDPFAAMAVGTAAAAAAPDPFTPSNRAELPADIFSAPVVAPIPTFPQPAPNAFAAVPPTAGMQMPVATGNPPLGMMGSGSMQYSPAGGMQGMMPTGVPNMMPPGPAMPGLAPQSAMPGMAPTGLGMPPVKPAATNMGGPSAMQMPAPLKKDPFADLF